jgi:hypothetical protein
MTPSMALMLVYLKGFLPENLKIQRKMDSTSPATV